MIWNCHHFKRQNIEFTSSQQIFKFSYLFKNYILKKFMYLDIIIIYYNNLKNNCSKTHLYEKMFFGRKDM